MKRSEMLKIIVNRLNLMDEEFNDCDEDFIESTLDDANAILTDIEGAGMLPPLNHDSLYSDGDNAKPKSITYRTWEGE